MRFILIHCLFRTTPELALVLPLLMAALIALAMLLKAKHVMKPLVQVKNPKWVV